jgi:PKD repeat protein
MRKLSAIASKFHRTVMICALAALAGPALADINLYVATNGNDSIGNGTIGNPYATLAKAVSIVSTSSTGGTVFMRGGTYAVSSQINMTKIGSSGSRYTVTNYPGEVPLLNFTSQLSGEGIRITGAYWQLFGLVITNAAHNGINIRGGTTAMMGSFNRIERCVVVGNRDSGILIGSNSGTFTAKPSSNTVLNCDATRNYDSAGHGGNADGFTAKWVIGPGNEFIGCRACENSDDGWDLWMGQSPVVISNCWTWRNGSNVFDDASFVGNGNGFKLGGNNVPANHTLVYSLAYQNVGNGGYGIDQNNNTGNLTVDQNTSWGNRVLDINLAHSPSQTEHHIVRNNLVMLGGASRVSITGNSTVQSNSWQVISPNPDSSDVVSMDTSQLAAPRQADGSLPVITLVHPVSGGRLVDKGIIIAGYPYNGSAPDLGAFETVGGAPPVAAFTGSPTSGTAPLAVTFTDSSTGSITNRFWDFGDSNTTNTSNTTMGHTYNTGTYTVTLIVSGSSGSDTNTKVSYIVATNIAPPVASFTGNPTNGAAPLNVTFTDTSTGSITNRFWDFGDSTSTNTTSTSVGHTYNAGTFGVNLTVSGPGGSNTVSKSNYITVLNSPVADFTAGPTTGTEPLTVTFTDTSTGSTPLSLAWNLGDSTTTNTTGGASVGHTYAAGTYTVTLTASNSVGVSTLVSNNLIHVITGFQAWQQQYFNCTNCPEADAAADPDGDGQNNQAEFLVGTDPTSSASGLIITSMTQQGSDVVITWKTAGGHTNVVQATAGDGSGGYSTNGFADISGSIVISGSGDAMTNFTDSGGTTNSPSRYYRVLLVP